MFWVVGYDFTPRSQGQWCTCSSSHAGVCGSVSVVASSLCASPSDPITDTLLQQQSDLDLDGGVPLPGGVGVFIWFFFFSLGG